MKILVCGGRTITPKVGHSVRSTLAEYMAKDPDLAIIHGNADGVDSEADDWARSHCIPRFVFPANWGHHKKAAGPIRNSLMLKVGKPDLVIAFPGGVGTADMVKKAKAVGVKVIEIPSPDVVY
jgi:hypothetical protein